MKKCLPALVVLLLYTIATAQGPDAKTNSSSTPATNTIPPVPAINANSTPLELARAALAAQGGDKFKNLKSTMVTGTANLYAPNSLQSLPGKFVMVTAGDKVRVDIDASPVFKFKQVFDGQQSFSSMPGVSMPPVSRFGLPVLAKFDQPGYTVSAVPDKKKLRGFRIADSDGNTTDFYIDPGTGRVMQFVVPYQGYTFSAEHTKFNPVDGVLIPYSYSWRLESPMGAFFAEFKVKDVKLNQPIGDDVFAIQ